jgi:hypothetical protein
MSETPKWEDHTPEEWAEIWFRDKYRCWPYSELPKYPCKYCGVWPYFDEGIWHHVCDTIGSHLDNEMWDCFNEQRGGDS